MTESVEHRWRLPCPRAVPFLFVRQLGVVLCRWSRDPSLHTLAHRDARCMTAELTHLQLEAIEAVRARLANHAGELPAVAWISEAGLTPVQAEPAWLARKLHDQLSVPVRRGRAGA